MNKKLKPKPWTPSEKAVATRVTELKALTQSFSVPRKLYLIAIRELRTEHRLRERGSK